MTCMGYDSMVWEGLCDWLEQKLQSKRGVKGATRVKKGVRREVVQGGLLVHGFGGRGMVRGVVFVQLAQGRGLTWFRFQ